MEKVDNSLAYWCKLNNDGGCGGFSGQVILYYGHENKHKRNEVNIREVQALNWHAFGVG